MASEEIIKFVRRNKGKTVKVIVSGVLTKAKIIGYKSNTNSIIIRFFKDNDRGWSGKCLFEEDIIIFNKFNFNNYNFWYEHLDNIIKLNPELNNI